MIKILLGHTVTSLTKINPSKLNFDEYETNLKDIKIPKIIFKNITINNIMNELFDDFMYRFFPLPISEINKEMMLIYLEAVVNF